MAHRLQFRRDTRVRWLEINPVLMEGEIGFETDTHNGKVGDGISKYSELEYSNTIAFESITQILGQSTTLVPSQKLVTNEINRIDEIIGPWDSTRNGTITDEIGQQNVKESDENYNKGLWGQMRNTIGRLSKVEENNKENEKIDSNQTKIIAQHDTLLNPMTLTLNGGGLYEKGTTQTINLTWSAMKGNSPITPVSLLEVWVNDDLIPVDDVSYSEQITESKRFKVMTKFSYDVLGETVTISDTKYANATFVGAMWFGFSEYDTMSEIDMTTGTFIKQPLKTSPSGTYTFNNPANGYLWLCIPDNMTINKVTMSGFDVPVTELNEGGVPGYRNFRSDNKLVAGNYTIVIS